MTQSSPSRNDWAALASDLELPRGSITDVNEVHLPIARWLNDKSVEASKPFVLGVNGAQGAGKSTFCRLLAAIMEQHFKRTVATLSIDDFYLTRNDRQALAQTVHPLCAIRGLPGTHDVALGIATLDTLINAKPNETTRLPRFDKATDDRVAPERFDTFTGAPQIILLEGWCVGVKPGPAWNGPINAREARDDAQGIWTRWSEDCLRSDYPELFRKLDALMVIQVPSFQSVIESRQLQEQRLSEHVDMQRQDNTIGVMTPEQVKDYVLLFERKTRAMFEQLPPQADVLVARDNAFRYELIRCD